MSQAPIDLPALRAQQAEAFADLGFKVNETRKENFFQLCTQWMKHYGRHAVADAERSGFHPPPSDVLDYAVATFVHHLGEQIWPPDNLKCGHLDRSEGAPARDLVVAVPQDDQIPGDDPQSFWQRKLNSPLGKKVKRYFEILQRIPWYTIPDGTPSPGSIMGLVWQVLDTSADS